MALLPNERRFLKRLIELNREHPLALVDPLIESAPPVFHTAAAPTKNTPMHKKNGGSIIWIWRGPVFCRAPAEAVLSAVPFLGGAAFRAWYVLTRRAGGVQSVTR